jgi:signal transduction histidine kinase
MTHGLSPGAAPADERAVRLARAAVLLGGVAATVLLVVVSINTTGWIGRTFPGFFVMANRVVPSIALPDWSRGNPSRLFQHQVIAVDGRLVHRAEDVYADVEARAPGSTVRYTVRAPGGEVFTAEVPARRFSGRDHALLFVAYLLTGVAFLSTGLLVIVLKPRSAASVGLLGACLTTGIFVVTAADLYGPHWFVRLHVLAESFLTAGFIHLALVFPTDRLRGRRLPALVAVYLPFGILALLYEIALPSASAYTAVHLCATAAHGVGALAITAAVGYDLVTSRSALVRRRIGVVALGTLTGFLIPGVLMAASALLGGRVPLNAGAFTAFLFPLSLGYAIVKQDLFDIDVLLRRAVTHTVVLLAIAGCYLAGLSVVGMLIPTRDLLAQSPITVALLNLGILFLIAPIKQRVQNGVDRLFFRRRYDAERALSDLSHTLSSAHALEDVLAQTGQVLGETLCPATATVLATDDGTRLRWAIGPEGRPAVATLPAELAERLGRGLLVARYEWDDGSGRPLPLIWHALAADVLVPVRSGGRLIAALVLGPKGSGHPYTVHDAAFLRAVASQVALALTNARAFTQLEALNAGLEAQVRDRTAAFETANRDLNRSLEELRRAYQQLERSQASLVRADRLATLGRLTAGIAHEVNTPLGAVLNALKLLTDLGREYAESIDDAAVSPEDHREIAREMVATAESATGWVRKAAAFISKVKTHGREPRPTAAERFAVSAVVRETEALLAHRLRTASCVLDFAEDPDDVALMGEPTRLGQVLVNLVGNAIDAYEDAGAAGGPIEVRARCEQGTVTLTVRDWAGGIPPDIEAHIFDELYTTKEPGRGTGLGLWIARNLVEERFGGTLTVETEPGVGSCFIIAVPAGDGAVKAA